VKDQRQFRFRPRVDILEDRQLLATSLLGRTLRIEGTEGPDTIEVFALEGNDDVSLSSPNKFDQLLSAVAHVESGAGHDRLIGGGLNDTLVGSAGSDVLNGGAGIDRLEASGDVS
jgi:Ca2+-binding RTX toxin-like protein